MKKHIKILLVINMFGQITTSRVIDFAGLPEKSTKSELEELKDIGLIKESETQKGVRTFWNLTDKGENLLNLYQEIIPEHVKSDISDLKTPERKKCHQILQALESNPKTVSQIIKATTIKKKELTMFLLFLEKNGHIRTCIRNNKILHYPTDNNVQQSLIES